jgi:hypothetical protein
MEYAPGDIGPRALNTQSTLVSWGRVVQNEIDFWSFHLQNSMVYQLYKQYAFAVINQGRTRLSSKALINRVRWDTDVVTTSSDFKINDKWQPYYARLFMREFSMPDFFETRVVFGENELFTGYPSDYPDEL